MPAYAFFDVGSNSVLCLLVEVDGPTTGQPPKGRVLYDGAIVTGLGRGLSPEGLNVESKERTLEALRTHMAQVEALDLDVKATGVGTSAMRDAKDGADFAEVIKEELGIDVAIISGEREAELTWLAATSSFPYHGDGVLIDIGGGSTEFMSGDGANLEFRASLDIGSVRLTGRHIDGDPPSARAIDALAADARGRIAKLPPLLRGRRGMGSAGTITSLLALRDGVDPYDPKRIHGKVLALEDVTELVERLAPMRVADRAALPGLHPARAEAILAGGIILREAMEELHLKELLVSDRGLRFGVMADALPGLVLEES